MHRFFSKATAWLSLLTTLSLCTSLPGAAAADAYPSRAIHVVAPIAAGGPSDTAARLIAQALSAQLGQPVVVDNRTGAGGVVGTEFAAQAQPDGYTLLLSIAATFTIIPAAKKVRYDPVKDFIPLGQVWDGPQALVVRPNTFRSLSELVAQAKANPDKLTFGSAGTGTTTHLSIVLLSKEAGVSVTHVPYRGTSQSLTDLLGGQIDAIFGDLAVLAPRVKGGSLVALAVTSAKRSSLLPDVPTTVEAGLPEVNTNNWYGLHALAGTPPEIVARLKAAVRAAQADPAYTAELARLGTSTGTVGADDFGKMVQREANRWAPIISTAGIKFE